MLGLLGKEVFDDFWRDIDARGNCRAIPPDANLLNSPLSYARRHDKIDFGTNT